MSLDSWGIVTLLLSFCMSFSIGANDAANGLATSYGSKALSLRKLIAIGAVAEFTGAMFCSDQVAATLGRDIVPELPTLAIGEQKRMMFSVCLCSFAFIMTSSFSGMPISGTHTVIGALLGAGVVATGFSSLHWTKLGYIILSWFVSPALAALVTLALMSLVAGYTMDTAHLSYRARLLSLQLISTLSFAIVSDLLATLLGVGYAPKDPHTPAEIHKDLDKGLTHEHWYIQYWMLIMTVSVLLIGTAVCRLLILSILVSNSKVRFSVLQLLSFAMVAVFSPLNTELFEKLTLQIELDSDEITSRSTLEEMQNEYDFVKAGLLQLKEYPQISFDAESMTDKEAANEQKASVLNLQFKADSSQDAEVTVGLLNQSSSQDLQGLQKEQLEKSLTSYFRKQAKLTSELYRYLMILSAFLVCLSHGSNDVGNAISPLLILMKIEGQPDYYSFLLGSAGIALGLLVMGVRVMETVGKEIVVLDFMKGFSSQFATATCVCLGSSLGLPLSTTHCMIGALAGVHVAGKTPWMKQAYSAQSTQPDGADRGGAHDTAKDDYVKPQAGEASKMNFKTVKKILFWWAITIPCAMSATALCCWVLLSV